MINRLNTGLTYASYVDFFVFKSKSRH